MHCNLFIQLLMLLQLHTYISTRVFNILDSLVSRRESRQRRPKFTARGGQTTVPTSQEKPHLTIKRRSHYTSTLRRPPCIAMYQLLYQIMYQLSYTKTRIIFDFSSESQAMRAWAQCNIQVRNVERVFIIESYYLNINL